MRQYAVEVMKALAHVDALDSDVPRNLNGSTSHPLATVDATDLTGLLSGWSDGDQNAGYRLVSEVYRDLHAIAQGYVRRERHDLTLQATALVHEAYLRLSAEQQPDWQNRSHFFATAARIMRRVLVDHARGRLTAKRGGDQPHVTLENAEGMFGDEPAQLVALDEALDALAKLDPGLAKIVELRFFAGYQFQEIARHLGLSSATLNRRWRIARGWLYNFLQPEP